MIRLGGDALDRAWFSEAEVDHSECKRDLCRTQVTLRLTDRPARELLDDPLGNHLAARLRPVDAG